MIENFVLIIGSAKSGTSSLFNYLAEHPEVAPCRQKETQFFAETDVFDRGFTYYQKLWNWEPSKHKIALEATPNYTRVTHKDLFNAAEKIASIKDSKQVRFKFIYIMRSPIARIESHYTHLEAWGQENRIKPYAQGLESEIIDVSKYAMQLDEYYQRFPAEDILLLNFEELKANPELLLRRVCKFLEVDSDYQFQALDTIHNSNKARKKVFLPGWKNIRQTSLIRTIARATPNEARKIFKKLFGKEVTQQIKLSEEERKYVLNYLRSDMDKLTKKYQVNTSLWDLPNLVSSSNQIKD